MKQISKVVNKITGLGKLFIWTVFIPTMIAILYFGFIAADIYISEATFVVRSPDRQTASPLGLVLKGAGITRSQDDSYTVKDFMQSRDALQALDARLNMRNIFAKGDALSRFPGPDFDNSFESMHRYFQKMVQVQMDPTSGIATVSVSTFDPQDAQKINKLLLEMSENLVNKLNERARSDMLGFSTKEVESAAKRAKTASLELARFRNVNGVIDPLQQATMPLQQIARLQEELTTTKAQLAQLEMLAKDNPQVAVYKARIQIIQSEIDRQTKGVAGNEKSLAGKATEYQRLAMEKEFADKMLASAFAALDLAHSEAQRKQLYLERIAQPSLPDTALEPRRIRTVLAIFVLGLIFWGVLSMLAAGVKEHQD